MAGIGFELQKLSVRGGLLAPFQAIGQWGDYRRRSVDFHHSGHRSHQPDHG